MSVLKKLMRAWKKQLTYICRTSQVADCLYVLLAMGQIDSL